MRINVTSCKITIACSLHARRMACALRSSGGLCTIGYAVQTLVGNHYSYSGFLTIQNTSLYNFYALIEKFD